jgi:bla regulator protein blaR1
MKPHRSRPACISTALLAITCSSVPIFSRAQAPTPQLPAWQAAAGGHMEFEVASIRPGEPCVSRCASFDMSAEDTPMPAGDAFLADFPLPVYIGFAYKILLTREQEQAMVAHLPKWVGAQPFVIEAKAPISNPTKDQMRLMMQALLADRFKLVLHFQSRDSAVLAMVLVRPKQLGPRIQPHERGLACDAQWSAPVDRTSPSVPPGGFLPSCGAFRAVNGANHTILFGARNVSLQSIAGNLGTLPPVTQFGRSVVDQTGLAGTYDFSLNWLPERSGSASGAGEPPDAQGPTFEEALRDQLGLKLKPTHAEVQTLVIDHVGEPSPN